jgi:hypothetical protein
MYLWVYIIIYMTIPRQWHWPEMEWCCDDAIYNDVYLCTNACDDMCGADDVDVSAVRYWFYGAICCMWCVHIASNPLHLYYVWYILVGGDMQYSTSLIRYEIWIWHEWYDWNGYTFIYATTTLLLYTNLYISMLDTWMCVALCVTRDVIQMFIYECHVYAQCLSLWCEHWR